MSKFVKRLLKYTPRVENALVIGTAFGQLPEILATYKTVFVISEKPPEIKARNLVYRENFDHLNQFTEISIITFDLNQIHLLETFKDVWQRNQSVIVIEGDEPIGREFSKPLYNTSWGCRHKLGLFHTWEQIK